MSASNELPDPPNLPARQIVVVAGTRRLDAYLHEPAGPARGCLVFGHPHPLHGGNMDHPVVVAAAERAAAAGLLALRWDVGGVRASEGDKRDAESHRDDLHACARELLRRAPGKPLFGGGFSYGGRLFASVVAPVAGGPAPFAGGLLLAPATHVPATARDFGNLLLGRPPADAGLDPRAVARLRELPVPAYVIVGELDVVAPPKELRTFLPATATLEVLPGLNHFFSRSEGAGTTARDLLLPALDRAFASLLP